MRARITAKLLTARSSQATARPFEIRDTSLTGFLPRVQPSGKRTYYVQLSRSLRVWVGPADVLTLDEARERVSKILGNHAHGRPPLEGITGADGETLESFIEKTYKPWLAVNRP